MKATAWPVQWKYFFLSNHAKFFFIRNENKIGNLLLGSDFILITENLDAEFSDNEDPMEGQDDDFNPEQYSSDVSEYDSDTANEEIRRELEASDNEVTFLLYRWNW